MAKGLDELVEWLIAEISYSGENGFTIDNFVSATTRYYTGETATSASSESNDTSGVKEVQAHDGVTTTSVSNGNLNLARKAWAWVVIRDEVSVGPEKAWNHLSFDSLRALPREAPPIDPALSSQDEPQTSQISHPEKSSGATDQPLIQPRIFVSEETAWVAITGHGPDHKRIPLLEWKCLLGIASTGKEGIIQGDLRRLVNQDKRSVPKRTDFLAMKGYIEKRTVIANATKTSKLWITKFAPPELTAVDVPEFGQAQGLDLSQDFLTKDLDPVPWCARWTGSSIDHTIFSQTALAIVRAWKVMRLTDLKMKMGILGQKWQMRVLARTFRRLATMGLIKYVAALLPGRRQVLKDCVKWIREPTKEEWVEHLATGTRTSQYSDQTHDRQPKELTATGVQKAAQNAQDAAGGNGDEEDDEQILPAIRSPWDPDKPFANQVFEQVKRMAHRGATNPLISTATVGFAFRRFMFAWLQQAAKRNSQPAHLRHFQLQSELVRIGKTEAYIFKAGDTSSIHDTEPDTSPQDQDMSIAQLKDVTSINHGSFRFSAPVASIANQTELPSNSKLSAKLANKHRPARQYRRARTALPEPPASTKPNLASAPIQGVTESAEIAEEAPAEPKPNGVFIVGPSSRDPLQRKPGRPRKSLVVLVRLEQLKDPEALTKTHSTKAAAPSVVPVTEMERALPDETGSGLSSSEKRKSDDQASADGHPHLDSIDLTVGARYNGAEGHLIFVRTDKVIRFEAATNDGIEPLAIKIDDLAADPTIRDAPRGDDKALVFNAQEDGSDTFWPYIFLFNNSLEGRDNAALFQQSVTRARAGEPDAMDVDEGLLEGDDHQEMDEESVEQHKTRGRKRKGTKKGASAWKCDKCGGTWKNDIGLKYHLTKSKTTCNKDYVPQPILEERPRKRQKVEQALNEPEFGSTGPQLPTPAPVRTQSPSPSPAVTPAPAPAPGPAQSPRSLRSEPEKIASKAHRHLMGRKARAGHATSTTPRGFLADGVEEPTAQYTSARRVTPPPVTRRPATEQTTRPLANSKSAATAPKQIEVLSAPKALQEPGILEPVLQASQAGMMLLDPRLRDGDNAISTPGHRKPTQATSPQAGRRPESLGNVMVYNQTAFGANQHVQGSGWRQPLGKQSLTSNVQPNLTRPSGKAAEQGEGGQLETSNDLCESCTADQSGGRPYLDHQDSSFDPSETAPTIQKSLPQPPPFVMPTGRDLSKLTAAQIRIHQSEELMKYFLEYTEGVFPSQQALWFAVITAFLKAFPEENPPRKNICNKALNRLINKKIVSEHVYGFRDQAGKIVHVRMMIKSGVSPNGSAAKALKEKMQEAYPRVYIPPAFSPNDEDLNALQEMEPDFERDKNIGTQRALAEEVEVLAAPFYEATKQSPRKRSAVDDEAFSLQNYGRRKRRTEDHNWQESPLRKSKVARTTRWKHWGGPISSPNERVAREQGQEGLHYAGHWEGEEPHGTGMSVTNAFRRYHLTSRRKRRRNHFTLQEEDDYEVPSSPRKTELDERIEQMFNEPLLKFSRPQIGGSANLPQVNLTFLEPNSFLMDDPEPDSSVSRSSSPAAESAADAIHSTLPDVPQVMAASAGPAVPVVAEPAAVEPPVEKAGRKPRKARAGRKRGRQTRSMPAEEEVASTVHDEPTARGDVAIGEGAAAYEGATSQESAAAVTFVGPWTETIVLEGMETSATAVPRLPNSFFEKHSQMSFTIKGWMPDAAFILRSNLPQSLADIGSITRGYSRRESWADPDWADFNQKVDGCLRWELSEKGTFLLSIPAATTEYFFMIFDAPKVTDPTPGKPLNFEWLAEDQFTPATIPYQTLIAESGWEPDIEDYEDWNKSTTVQSNDSPVKRKRGRPRGSRSKTHARGTYRGRRRGRRGMRAGEPRLPVFRKMRDHTLYPHYPEDHFQDVDGFDDVDWKADDTRIAAFVAVRTLLGGVDKIPDWGIMLRIFPDSKISNLRHFWLNIKKERQLYIDSLTAKFQEAFLEAYENDELPQLDYDNVLAYDWRFLVSWTTKLIVNDAQRLPATREVMQQEFSIVKSASRGGDWQERYYQTVRSVWKRFQDATSEAAATNLEREVVDVDLSSDDVIARSWLRALCRTPPEKYSPELVRDALLKLGERTDREINELLNTALKALRNGRVIKQTRLNVLSTQDRPYQFSDYWINQLDKMAQREKFIQAGQFKAHLDECFRNGEAYEIPYGVDDGTIVVLTNLQANGRIRIEAVDLQDMPFGFDPGNYESRKYPKDYYHFDTRAVPTDTYKYNQDIEDVMARADGPQRPNKGPRGELAVWCDFFGEVMAEPWVKIMGAAVFGIATRGSMDAAQLSSALKPLVEPFEAGMLLDWAVRADVLAAPVRNKGWTTKEWWWLTIAREYERAEGGVETL